MIVGYRVDKIPTQKYLSKHLVFALKRCFNVRRNENPYYRVPQESLFGPALFRNILSDEKHYKL